MSFSQKLKLLRKCGDEGLVGLTGRFRSARDAFCPSRAAECLPPLLSAGRAVVERLDCAGHPYELNVALDTVIKNTVAVETPEGYKTFNLISGQDVPDAGRIVGV